MGDEGAFRGVVNCADVCMCVCVWLGGTGAAGHPKGSRMEDYLADFNVPAFPSASAVRYRDGADPLGQEKWADAGGVSAQQFTRFLAHTRPLDGGEEGVSQAA